MRKRVAFAAALLATVSFASPGFADMEAAKKWVESEFQPSTLSKEDQLKEMEFFIKAAEPFKGMEVSPNIREKQSIHFPSIRSRSIVPVFRAGMVAERACDRLAGPGCA